MVILWCEDKEIEIGFGYLLLMIILLFFFILLYNYYFNKNFKNFIMIFIVVMEIVE